MLGGIPVVGDIERSELLLAQRLGEIGSVHSWELVTAVDGPGTRMTTFLAGCPLRCLYCHNPDTMAANRGVPVRSDDLLARIRRYRGCSAPPAGHHAFGRRGAAAAGVRGAHPAGREGDGHPHGHRHLRLPRAQRHR
ncbi:4Fe-4S cluster-binding domain-containing protein [Tessaracoccus coleopterorum]|uniref:4Fe-4S cluster-binding domain-containing protein n=1 Tax=Tessaracoccus coleopterorum TaxID=2714950 RepID=UPI0038CD9281